MQSQKSSQLQEQVAALKRNNEYSKAVLLLESTIEQEETDSIQNGFPVSSWPYHQLAIIARKDKRYKDEIAIIERYIQLPRSGSKQGQKLIERLPKAYEYSGLSLDDTHPKFCRKALFVDVETTGLSHQDEVIELAAILVRYSILSGRILGNEDEYSSLHQPSIRIPPAATAKHGITDRDVRGKRIDKNRVRTLLAEADILVAHNASYDHRMLAKLFPQVAEKQWYCTLNGIDWRGKGCAERSLEYLLHYYEITETQQHRAYNDVASMLALLSQVDDQTQQSLFYELICGKPVNFRSRAPIEPNIVTINLPVAKLPWWKRLLGLG